MTNRPGKSIWANVIRAIIWLLLAIISGVAGNYAYESILEIVPRLGQYIQLYAFSIFVVLSVVIMGLGFGWWYYSRQMSRQVTMLSRGLEDKQKEIDGLRLKILDYGEEAKMLRYSNEASDRLFTADDGLLRLLPQLVVCENKESLAQEIAYRYLRDIKEVFDGVVVRAIILRPNKEKTYLESWVSYDVSPNNLQSSRFYIGDEVSIAQQRGVAGEVYVTRRLRVIHFFMRDDRWVADDPAYYPFSEEKKGPSYRSAVVFPIVESVNEHGFGRCLGVFSINSTEIDAFDSSEVQNFLYLIANRFWLLITISEYLGQNNTNVSRVVG